MTAKDIGARGEKIAAFYLEKKGYKILRRNFRIRGGELDIIAEKDGFIAFVEVKTRTPGYIEGGLEAVNLRKQRLIIRAAEAYSCKNPHDLQPRFDVVEIILDGKNVVSFNYVENAFCADGMMTIL